MPKHIVLCSDGTGNRGGKFRGTNVWRLYNALDLTQTDSKPSIEQIRYYDDGVGTEDLQWIRHITGAFGIGISRNIRQLYQFLSMQFSADDADLEGVKIFLFGFSRGAYTIRSLANMIHELGIINGKQLPPDKLTEQVKKLYNAYRSKPAKRIKLLNAMDSTASIRQRINIEFIGVWDTVDAIGLPVDELKHLFYFSPRTSHKHALTPSTKNAYHALSIDDERHTFHPVMWDESKKCEGQVIKQVWFAGVHSNVGGGYPKDHLSYVSLLWMISKAENCGLKFDTLKLKQFQRSLDINGKIYDSRSGLGSYYRYLPRDIQQLCQLEGQCSTLLHNSVIQRIRNHKDFYRPTNIPTENLDIEGSHQPEINPSERGIIQKEAQGYVYWRMLTYNLTIVLTLIIVWVVVKRSSVPISLDMSPSSWVTAILDQSLSILCVIVIALLFYFNKTLKRKINIVGWRAWFATKSKTKSVVNIPSNNSLSRHVSHSAVATYNKIESISNKNTRMHAYLKNYKWILILAVFAWYLISLCCG